VQQQSVEYYGLLWVMSKTYTFEEDGGAVEDRAAVASVSCMSIVCVSSRPNLTHVLVVHMKCRSDNSPAVLAVAHDVVYWFPHDREGHNSAEAAALVLAL
jgi:hypothetical protein